MPIKLPEQFHPPLWHEYEKRRQHAAITPWFAAQSEVNRFRARYRFAKSFRGLNLEGYAEDTKAGYEALTKVAFVWSAYEQMLRALKIQDGREIIKNYPMKEVIKKIKKLDTEFKFFRFVRQKLKDENHLKDKVTIFIDGGACTVLTLAASVRHIYLHGHLTANVQRLHPSIVSQICDLLADSILIIIDSEFKESIENLMIAYPEY
jgi:hypothetical protein